MSGDYRQYSQNESGVIDAPIARLGTGAKRGVVSGGQRAVTHYRVEQIHKGRALIRLKLETGRTHQIRVHLSSMGCPILGDYLYGNELPELKDRFALHSAHLRCIQPVTGQMIDITEPLPRELQILMENE
ncbi:MAG: pseudouridine synthase [Christensenellales bacterium]